MLDLKIFNLKTLLIIKLTNITNTYPNKLYINNFLINKTCC